MIEALLSRLDLLAAGSPAGIFKPLLLLGQVAAPMAVPRGAAPAATQPYSIHSIFTFIGGTPAASQPAAAPRAPAPPAAPSAAASATEVIKSYWHAPWQKWLTFYDYQIGLRAISTFVLLVLCWWVLARLFRKQLMKYKLERATAWGAISAIIYFTLLAAHPLLMIDHADIIAVTIHKLFGAIMAIVGIRYVDRLIVMPVLTRMTGGPPSRFIHQIVISVITVFVIAFYCSEAFGSDIGSLLAGSAVISIVLGLALQETLGNFFSGMVLQTSMPFQTGDWIQLGTLEGRVVEMTWRAVTLITNANNYVLIPNSSVAKEQIVNYHSPTVATSTSVAVGLDYAIPPNDAKRVLIQAAKDTPGVLAEPAPSASLASFDDSSILYKVFFWINEPQKHGSIEQAVRVNLWYRLNQADYGIPFPVRTVEMTDLDKKQATGKQAAQALRLASLKASPMFSDIAPELQEKLAADTRGYELSAGQVFYRQDDPGDSLFILEAGTVQITVRGANGKETDVAELSAPAVFGEVSAVTGQPRSATYKAKTDTRVVEIDRNHLQGLFTQDPRLMDHFSQLIAERQVQRDALLKKAGATQPSAADMAHEQTMLDRMKHIFVPRHK